MIFAKVTRLLRAGWIEAAALILPASALALAAPKVSTAAPAAQDTSFRSCKTVALCTDILERHPSDSFDYAVLARDFDYFGETGRKALWGYVEGVSTQSGETEITLANRALDIMSRSSKILSPADQRRIADMWARAAGSPFDIDTLARIMSHNISPMVRSFAVRSLGSPNAEIAQHSRRLIDKTLRIKMDFPMPARDFVPLKKALLHTPSPRLVALMDKYEPAQSAAVFAQLLRSGEAPAVIAAYNALYAQSPEDAFKALVSTLFDLRPDETQAALAISELLYRRHPLRSDGFYMNFASELAVDTEMSAAGRLAGFDALLKLGGEKKAPAILDSPLTRESFSAALAAYGAREKQAVKTQAAGEFSAVPLVYFTLPQRLNTKTADVWLAPLNAAAHSDRSRIALTELAGQYDSPLAQQIARRSFNARDNYLLETSAILALAAQSAPSNSAFAAQLNQTASTHPMSLVRAVAKIGAKAVMSSAPRKAILKSQSALTETAKTIDASAEFCSVTPTNFRGLARAMPFYAPAKLASGYEASRSWLRSGTRHASGWLAGYSRPEDGGLVSYQNRSGGGEELFSAAGFASQAVVAVQPVRPVKLGDKAREFWVIGAAIAAREAAVYRLSQTRSSYDGEARFTLKRHAVLPALPSSVKLGEDGNMTIAMGRSNPPLTLLPSGELRRSCGGAAG